MGLLLKIILFGVAVYGLWKTFSRWKGLFDTFVGRRPPAEPPPARPEQARPAPPPAPPVEARRSGPIEDVVQCDKCGAYVSARIAKCEQCGHPLPEGRSPG